MKARLLVSASNIGFTFLLVIGFAVEAAEIKVLSGVAIRAIMEDLGPKFERASGHKLAMTFDGLSGVVKRIKDGETADVVVIPRQGIDGFVKDGKTAAGNVTDVARSDIGVAVRKGSAKPDISSPEALKRTLLAAKSISYSEPDRGGRSGIHFAKVLDRLGIANEMKRKTVFPPTIGGIEVGELVASGKAEIGVHQLPVFARVAGIEIVGPLPGDLQDTIVFAAVERTLSIIKPDAVAGGLIGDILKRFEAAGLKIVAAKLVRLSLAQAEAFYAVHKERPFFPSLTAYMSSGPIFVAVLEGEAAIAKNRQIMGATDPAKAAAGTIRRDWGKDVEQNAVHGSDGPETAATEIAFFFKPDEIIRSSSQ